MTNRVSQFFLQDVLYIVIANITSSSSWNGYSNIKANCTSREYFACWAPVPAQALMRPLELQQLALNFLATSLVVTSSWTTTVF